MHELVAQLRELPDDWGTWLVYADALIEQGDERGQFLVLEHGGAAIGELADAWMATWHDLLPDEDADTFAWLRTLAPLAREPVFSRPISQLLALLEPSDEPREGLSPVLALQRDRVTAAMLAWIDRAFDGVPAPDDDHRTLHEAEAADNYQAGDRTLDHFGRWQDLPEQHLLDNQWAMAHLDEQGIHYYVPAVMTFALRHRETSHPDDHWITESLSYTLQPSNDNLRDYQQQRFALFSRVQRAATYAFTLVTGNEVASVAWSRVFVAERDGERADWFELYSPR